jgi:hypothetical protein
MFVYTLYLLDKVKGRVKLTLCLIKHHATKTNWEVEEWLHVFLASALEGDEWSDQGSCRVISREASLGVDPGYNITGPETEASHWNCRGSKPGCPGHSQSLYCLKYPLNSHLY